MVNVMKRLFTFLICVLLCISAILILSTAASGGDTRTDETITTFSNEDEGVYVEFLGPSENHDNEIRLQGGSLITSASIDIERSLTTVKGRPPFPIRS